MSGQDLEKLVKAGRLKREPGARPEYLGLVASARKRLADARDLRLSDESRFDLAYNAAHGFALAALRRLGYRPQNRYIVFQLLDRTAGLDAVAIRIFAKCHSSRNLAEYEGQSDVDERLLADLIRCTAELEAAVTAMKPPG